MHSKLLQHLPYDLNFIYLFFLSLWFVFFRLVFLSDGTHTVASPMATSEGPAVEPFPGFLWAAFHPWVQFRMLDLLKLLGITLAAFGAVNAASPAPLSESRIGGIGQVLWDPEWFLAAGMALWGQLGWQQMWARDGKYKKCQEKNKEQKEGEVLARWMERTQLRAGEGGDIQACWMFLMSSLGIHLLRETSVCCRLRISSS